MLLPLATACWRDRHGVVQWQSAVQQDRSALRPPQMPITCTLLGGAVEAIVMQEGTPSGAPCLSQGS